MKNNKGAIEIQLNWVFVLIIGAIIFVFFFSIVQKQRSIVEQESDFKITKEISSIMNGALSSEKTLSIIDINGIKFDVDCNGFGSDKNYFGLTPVFSPNFIEGKNMILWSRDFNMPFRAANFLYLTSNQVRYILVYDDASEGFMNDIYNLFPEGINIEKIKLNELDDLTDKNNYKVKLVFFEVEPPLYLNQFTNTPAKDVKTIKVVPFSESGLENDEIGTLSFSSDGDSYYASKEALLGAIFAENKEEYECAMKKAFKNLDLLSQIYTERAQLIIDEYVSGGYTDATECINNLDLIKTRYLQNIQLKANALTLSLTDAEDIKSIWSNSYMYSDSLSHYNNVLKIKSCPVIY